jgi:hypothetical protein
MDQILRGPTLNFLTQDLTYPIFHIKLCEKCTLSSPVNLTDLFKIHKGFDSILFFYFFIILFSKPRGFNFSTTTKHASCLLLMHY